MTGRVTRAWFEDAKRRFGEFICPTCGSHWFGSSQQPDGTLWRYCHDEFGKRCHWQGTDAECGLHDDVDKEVPAP